MKGGKSFKKPTQVVLQKRSRVTELIESAKTQEPKNPELEYLVGQGRFIENKDKQFLEEFENFFDELKIDHHTVFLGGDSNFDLLKINKML